MKLLNEEQFSEMISDLSEVINKIDNLNSNFDRDKIVEEIKLAIADNSLISNLKEQDFELESNLQELKRVRKSFIECSNGKIIKSLIIGFSGVVIGSIITSIIFIFVK